MEWRHQSNQIRIRGNEPMTHGEIFFIVGIIAIIVSVVLGIAAFMIFKSLRSRLNRQLDQEYGPQEKPEKKQVRLGPIE